MTAESKFTVHLVVVTMATLITVAVHPKNASALGIQQESETLGNCQVVSVGAWDCTDSNGKHYICDTPNNPDKNKNCIPARMGTTGPQHLVPPTGGAMAPMSPQTPGRVPMQPVGPGGLMRRGVESDQPAEPPSGTSTPAEQPTGTTPQ